MPKKRTSRIYWRTFGGERLAYADLRDYRDVLQPGEHTRQALRTADSDVAAKLAGALVEEYENRRRGKALTGRASAVELGQAVTEYLGALARGGRNSTRWIALKDTYLSRAVGFFGDRRQLHTIDVPDVIRWIEALQNTGHRRGQGLAGNSVLRHLSALSGVYQRAARLRHVPPGYNPTRQLEEDRPKVTEEPARWLEVHEAAALLEAATHVRTRVPCFQELLATFLLTGARAQEIFGLRLEDVSFDEREVRIRRHSLRRRLKNPNAERTVPLWPQLEQTLRPYVFGADRPPGQLLFPRWVGTEEQLFTVWTLRKPLLAAARRAGLATQITTPDGRREWKTWVTPKVFRHTYISARMQTTDGGKNVSARTVRDEIGHWDTDLIDQRYSHVGRVRHRADAVEYRVEQHAGELTPQGTVRSKDLARLWARWGVTPVEMEAGKS